MATTAKEMVTIFEDALKTNVGVVSVSVDGQTIQFDREQMIEELKFWQRESAKQAGKRSPFRSYDIGSAF